MKSLKAVLIIALCGLGTLFAGRVWEEKPFDLWTLEEAISVLSDSPWSQDVKLRSRRANLDEGAMANRPLREGSGTCVESTDRQLDEQAALAMERANQAPATWKAGLRTYMIRYVSAAPVRKALARWALLTGRLNLDQTRSLVNRNPFEGYVVVALSASNEQDHAELSRFSTLKLGEENYLKLKRSGRKIHAEKYVDPANSGLGEALFYFPSVENGRALIVSQEGKIMFHCRLSSRTEFKKEFDLKRMVVDSELQI